MPLDTVFVVHTMLQMGHMAGCYAHDLRPVFQAFNKSAYLLLYIIDL
jgi:hypothetical protein